MQTFKMIDYVNRKPRKKTESFGESLITAVACAVAMVVFIVLFWSI